MGTVEYQGLAHIARELEFFRSFNGAQLEKVLSHIECAMYDRGETIFKKGDPPNAFYIVYEGRVRIHLGYRFLGLMSRIAHLKAGDPFGERALMENRMHAGTATAEEPTKLFVLQQSDFDKLIHNDPEFADLIHFVVERRKPK